MDSSNGTTLARIWADATPLFTFVEMRAEQLCREMAKSKPLRDPGPAHKLSSIEQFARSMEAIADMSAARDRTRTITRNDLIAGRVVVVGRPVDAHNFERVDPSFWIGAEVAWGEGTVTRAGKKVLELRVLRPDDIPLVQPKLHELPGRPSKGEVIGAAIAEYAKNTDPTLSRPPLERRRAYYAYISAHGHDPRRERGFSEKTIQKFEQKFRKQNN